MAVNSIKVYRRHTLEKNNSGERIYPPQGSETYNSDAYYFLPLVEFSLTSSKGYVWKYNSSSSSNMSAKSLTYFELNLDAYDEKGSKTLRDALSESSYWSFNILDLRGGFVAPSQMTWEKYGNEYLITGSPSSTYSIHSNNIPTNAIIDMSFQQKTFTQSFDSNGGSGGPSYALKYYFQSFEFPFTYPTRTNYSFEGWKMTTGSTIYQPGDTVGDWKAFNSKGYIFYAQWEETNPITSIFYDGKTSFKTTDSTYYLPPHITTIPAGRTDWEVDSSNSSVVSISSYQLKIIGEGEAKLSFKYKGKTLLTVQITVSDYVKLKDISLSYSYTEVLIGNQFSVTLTVSPKEASIDSISWQCSDGFKQTSTYDYTPIFEGVSPIENGWIKVTVKDIEGTSITKDIDISCYYTLNYYKNEQPNGLATLYESVQVKKKTITLLPNPDPLHLYHEFKGWKIGNNSYKGEASYTPSSYLPKANAYGDWDYYPETITLNASKKDIEKGKTFDLNVTFDPSYVNKKTITWISNKDEVASVDENGIVTMKVGGGEGNTATITATAQKSSAMTSAATASCIVIGQDKTVWYAFKDKSTGKYYAFTDNNGKIYMFKGKIK